MICTLSKHEAEKQGYSESLMLDHEGNVAESTSANVFFKDNNGELHTPVPDCFLDGITRRTVIEIAKSKNIKVNVRKISPSEIKEFYIANDSNENSKIFETDISSLIHVTSDISKNEIKNNLINHICRTGIQCPRSGSTKEPQASYGCCKSPLDNWRLGDKKRGRNHLGCLI